MKIQGYVCGTVLLVVATFVLQSCTPRPKYVSRKKPHGEEPGSSISGPEDIHAADAAVERTPPTSPKSASIRLGPPVRNFSSRDLSSQYGARQDPRSKRLENHQGLDIRGKKGEAILATAHGSVAYAGWQNGFGRVVILEHPDGFHTVYAHLQTIRVRPGESVSKGHELGTMGSSGSTTGIHLHFELRRGSTAVDPMPYLVER